MLVLDEHARCIGEQQLVFLQCCHRTIGRSALYGGYRCELVYREHTGNAFFSFRSQPLTNTGLRLYDADGSKVLEVWPAAEEFSLRAWLVTFYTADGEACTVEYEPDKGDVADTVYIMTAEELLAQKGTYYKLKELQTKALAMRGLE